MIPVLPAFAGHIPKGLIDVHPKISYTNQYWGGYGKNNLREQIKKVPRMGDKAFEQCAGFLRVRNSSNPLDNTAVHPESYTIVEKMAKDLNTSVSALIEKAAIRK